MPPVRMNISLIRTPSLPHVYHHVGVCVVDFEHYYSSELDQLVYWQQSCSSDPPARRGHAPITAAPITQPHVTRWFVSFAVIGRESPADPQEQGRTQFY